MTDKQVKTIVSTLAACAILLVSSPTYAETASDFLASLEGSYAGRGEAQLLGDKVDRIACRIDNEFDTAEQTLSLSGECASTKGKDSVNGKITAKGNGIKGAFVSPRENMEVTQSSGVFRDGRMILSASMYDKRVQKMTRVQQVLERSGDGITAQFFTYDNASGSYEPTGSIKLMKR